MNVLTKTIGRILFAIPILIFGIFHFINATAMAGMVPLPGGIFWIYLTGVALVAASFAIILNKVGKLAAILLGLMLLIFAFGVHLPGILNAADEIAMQVSMSNMLKDIALAGGAWSIGALLD